MSNLTTAEYERMKLSRGQRRDDLAGGHKSGKPKKQLAPLPPIQLFIDETRRAALRAEDEWVVACLPYPLSVNAAYSIGVIGGKHTKARAMMRPSAAHEQYTEFAERFFQLVRFTPIVGHVQVIVDLYRARDMGDIDVTKLLFDCMQGNLYINDKQIKNCLLNMHDDPNFPRCVVSVRLKKGETLNLF